MDMKGARLKRRSKKRVIEFQEGHKVEKKGFSPGKTVTYRAG